MAARRSDYTDRPILRPAHQKNTGVTLQFGAASGRLPSGGALFVFDLCATALSIVLSLVLRFETINFDEALLPYLPVALLPLLVRPPVRLAFGLYRREWRFASTRDLRDILGSVVVGSVIIVALYGVAAFLDVPGANPFPRSFFLIEPLITAGLVGGVRLMLRMRIENSLVRKQRERFTRTLIYGAGEAGASLARASARDEGVGIHVVGFLDDDPRKHGSRLLGHRVHGSLDDLPSVSSKTGATQLLIAMPSRSGAPFRRATRAAVELGLDVKTVPPIVDWLTGKTRIAPPRSISVEDLLRREPVQLDIESIAKYLNGASVLVTGGGGSIGGELVRQIVRLGPRVLTVLDSQESALWNMERDVAPELGPSGVRLNPVLADVRDASGIDAVIRRAKPDVVFHAAALKHVPYVEMHPRQGVLTNVFGTRHVLTSCESAGVSRFVLISTDKAVEPTSIMGCTKRVAELLTLEVGRRTKLPYTVVRFGNVLGSSGSLIPLLERQLDDGLPLTITSPDATRYFMTLSESVMLILQAGAADAPAVTYVLDMGSSVRIGELVNDLVRMKGMSEDAVEYRIIGLRPGEKLHEKLFFDDEDAVPTGHPSILRAVSRQPADTASLDGICRDLEAAIATDSDDAVRAVLREAFALHETADVVG